jgi:hypothetical protein
MSNIVETKPGGAGEGQRRFLVRSQGYLDLAPAELLRGRYQDYPEIHGPAHLVMPPPRSVRGERSDQVVQTLRQSDSSRQGITQIAADGYSHYLDRTAAVNSTESESSETLIGPAVLTNLHVRGSLSLGNIRLHMFLSENNDVAGGAAMQGRRVILSTAANRGIEVNNEWQDIALHALAPWNLFHVKYAIHVLDLGTSGRVMATATFKLLR